MESAQLATKIRESLADAFGGFSQFEAKDIVRCVIGHMNNSCLRFEALEVSLEVLKEALFQEEERWEALTETPEREIIWRGECETGRQEVIRFFHSNRTGARSSTYRAPAIVD